MAFEGNGGALSPTSDFAMRAAVEHGTSQRILGWMPPSGEVDLDMETLRVDGWRVETWYAHRGYFDARFLGWDVQVVRPGRAARPRCVERGTARAQAQGRATGGGRCGARRRVVDLVGLVDPGDQTFVNSIEWVGLEEVGAPLRSLLLRLAPLQEGAPFDLEMLNGTEDLVRARLGEQSYARARVTTSVEVEPDTQQVNVVVDTDIGPACTFGAVTLTGEVGLNPSLISDAVRVVEGQSWKSSALGETQRSLFALGVYSVVNVVPDFGGPDAAVIPIRIELRESLPRQLRVGGGLVVESGRQQAHASAAFSHVNFLERLWRPQLDLLAGYASVTSFADFVNPDVPFSGGPVAQSDLSVTVPRFPAKAWQLRTAVGIEVGVEEGYRFFEPSFNPGLTWRASQHLTLGFDYRLANFQLIGESTIDPAQLEFENGYLLSALSQNVALDRRDDPVFPRQGGLWSATLTEAGGPVGGTYNFLRAVGDARAFAPVHRLVGFMPPTTLAGRVGTGIIQTYGDVDKAAVPIDERLYLGGSNSVRGWTRGHLGPYTCNNDLSTALELQRAPGEAPAPYECTSAWDRAAPAIPSLREGSLLAPEFEPIGGQVSLNGSAELRTYLDAGYGAVIFTDAGMVWSSRAEVDLSQLQLSAGLGLRYKSPIGPVRLDFAWRVTDPVMFQHERRLGVHFALAEAF
jgi:outer membrane protein assembly factor BamA